MKRFITAALALIVLVPAAAQAGSRDGGHYRDHGFIGGPFLPLPLIGHHDGVGFPLPFLLPPPLFLPPLLPPVVIDRPDRDVRVRDYPAYDYAPVCAPPVVYTEPAPPVVYTQPAPPVVYYTQPAPVVVTPRVIQAPAPIIIQSGGPATYYYYTPTPQTTTYYSH